jgi:hypothetical protein
LKNFSSFVSFVGLLASARVARTLATHAALHLRGGWVNDCEAMRTKRAALHGR